MQKSTISLADINGANGFTVTGTNAHDQIGLSIGSGDFNGDGIADMVIGAQYANSKAGVVYVVYGSSTSLPATLSVSSFNGANGFAITGVNANDEVGTSISSGDINGDGIADLLLGVPRVNSAYVVYGSRSPFPATLSVSSLNGANGFSVTGVNLGDALGSSISSGDINGDGIADLLLGAFRVNYATGVAYAVYGSRSPFPATLSVSSLNGAHGFSVTGINLGDSVGSSISSGDINGDGIADLLLGAPFVNSDTGAAYAVYGSLSPFPATLSLSSLNGTNGFNVNGVNANGKMGSSIGSGDINGDGIADLLIGATGVNSGAGYSGTGAAYAVYGSRSPFPATLSVSSLNGANGFTVTGLNLNDALGQNIGSGDINCDGIADLLLGAPRANSMVGAVYVVYGSHTPFPATLSSSSFNGDNSFTVTGVNEGDGVGIGISSGDINGDGIMDLLLGAYGVNSVAGAAYAVYVQNITLSPQASPSSSIGPQSSSSTPQSSGVIPQPSDHVVVNRASQARSFLSPVTDILATGLSWLGLGRQAPVANTHWALAGMQAQEEEAPSAKVHVNPPAFEQALVGNLALLAVLKHAMSPAKAQESQSTLQAQLAEEAKQFGEHPYGKLYYQELAKLDVDFMDETSVKAAVKQLSQNAQQRLLGLQLVNATQRTTLLAPLPEDLQGVLENWSEAIKASVGHDKLLTKAAQVDVTKQLHKADKAPVQAFKAKAVAWQETPSSMARLGFFARPVSALPNATLPEPANTLPRLGY